MAKKKQEPEVVEVVEASDAPAPVTPAATTPAVTPTVGSAKEKTHKIVPSSLNVIFVHSEDEFINGTLGKFDIIYDTKTNDIYRLIDKWMKMKYDSVGVIANGTVKGLTTGSKAILKKLS